jgi:Niemann-Pick C1 protein
MNRNGCCPLIVHKENKIWCEPKYIERFIKYIYSKFVLTPVGKVLIVIIAIGITAFSTERVFKIKQKFDPMWFIPSDSYFAQFVHEHREYYPSRGYEGGIYFTNLNYSENLPKLYEISSRLKNRTDIIDRVQTWVHPFGEYVEDDFDITKPNAMSNEDFQLQLSKFLFSTQGGEYQANFKFKEPLECGKPAKEIKISSINFNFRKFSEREEYIPAKKSLEKLINDMNFELNEESEVFLFGRIFGNWITDEIIDEEIFRNISLALIGVFFCTVIMIVNLQVCVMIFLCVLMSLVSVGGFMQLWGLTLDLVTCISLQLSVGLCIGEIF